MKMSLLNRILLFILLPMIITASAFSYLNYTTSRDILKEEIDKDYAMAAKTMAAALSIRIDSIVHMINIFADMRAVREILDDRGSGDTARGMQVSAAMSDLSKNFMAIEEAGLVARSGAVIAHTDPSTVGAARSGHQCINEALAGGYGSLTTTPNKLSGAVVTCIAIPVKDQNTIIGAIYATISWSKMEEFVVNSIETTPASTDFVLDRNGIVLTHPDRTEVGKDYSQNPAFRGILSSNTGGRGDYSIHDVSYTAYYEKVPFTDWSAIIQVRNDLAFAKLSPLARFNITLALIFAATAIAFALFNAHAVTSSIKRLSLIVGKISSGDMELTEREEKLLDADCRRSDEIGQLCHGARGMLQDLKARMAAKDDKAACAQFSAEEAKQKQRESETARHEELVAAAEQIGTVAEAIASISAQLSVQIEQAEKDSLLQAGQADETAGAMQKIKSAVLTVAKSTGQTSNLSSEAQEKAERCIAENSLTEKHLNYIHENTQNINDILNALDTHITGNGKLMQSICDIADQTHHLALNACIEAAHLKSDGRRISRSADEIGKMAKKVMDSSTNAAEVMRVLKEGIEAGMEHAETVRALSEQAGRHTANAGAMLRDIAKMMEETSKNVLDIVQACKSQSDISKDIRQATSQVETTAKDTNNSMHEAALAVTSLSEQSYILDTLVEGMKKS